MLDLGTLDALTDRQLLVKLIALLTSLTTVQHGDRSPSSTACRNGPPCSYRPGCWFSHAVSSPGPSVRRTDTTLSAQHTGSSAYAQRLATTWRTPRPNRASTPLTSPPLPGFSSGNAFSSLVPRRQRRRSLRTPPVAPRLASPASPPSFSSTDLGGQGCPFVHRAADTVTQTAKMAKPGVTKKNAGSERRRQHVNSCGKNKVNTLIARDKTVKNAGKGTKCKAKDRRT